jgi:UDP:flavonoid glycosyltransferase YjiC (YdhE family)
VLYVSSNGAGMGHLTRLMAMARRADGVRPLFLSMSQAVPVVGDLGFSYEYVPSRDDLGVGPRRWNRLLSRRYLEVLERERPAAVVFDGTFPYEPLVQARRSHPGTALVWSRRAMWRPGQGSRQLASADAFDLVLEPGELAAERDRGLTAKRHDAHRVDPVTLLDPDELVSRAEAAAELGTDPDRPTVLVSLGAGNINDLDSDSGRLVAALAAAPGLQVVVTTPAIANRAPSVPDGVRAVSVYPISRYLRAFDASVAAAGYNSFHEMAQNLVPTAYVPNASTAMDDQVGRAQWAQDAGIGLCVDALDQVGVDRVVAAFADPARLAAMRARCEQVARPNGAGPAQRLLEQLVLGRGTS